MGLNSFGGETIFLTSHLINHWPSRVLGFKSPMETLSLFYPNLPITNNLVSGIFGCVSGKLDLSALK